MSNTLKDYLAQLEVEPTDVDKLAEGLKPEDPKPVEPKPDPVEPVEVKTASLDLDDFVKVIDDRINLAFEKIAELQKEAVGAVGPTPDPQAVPENPALQLSRELGPEQTNTNNTINSLIQQLTNGGRMAGPNGYIAGPAGMIAGATARGAEPQVAAEAVMAAEANTPAKTAAEEVVGLVYNRFFGQEEQ